jgi:hypothetical protein
MPIISALGRLRQEDCALEASLFKFKGSLDYIMVSKNQGLWAGM